MALSSGNTVSASYAADGRGPAVYGRYKADGFMVNPLMHQIGKPVGSDLSPSEAFRAAGLDWTAQKGLLYYPGPDGEPVPSTEHCTITRSDNNQLLGVHGKGYTPIQQTAMIKVFEYLGDKAKIENILSIRDGRKVYATASIDIEEEVVPGDRVRRYLHIFNSHDGSSSFGAFETDIRLLCANQLTHLMGRAFSNALESGQGLRMKHTQKVEQFAEALPQRIAEARKGFKKEIQQFRDMSRIQLRGNDRAHAEAVVRVLQATYSDKLAAPIRDKDTGEKRERRITDLADVEFVLNHFRGSSGIGMELTGVQGTAWGLFNAITQHECHDTGRSLDQTERCRARLESLWGGQAAKRIDRARQACLALA